MGTSSFKKNIWTFFNSAFGIWFLSTIVIGLFTYFFNQYKEAQSDFKERESKIKHLDLEIESRISQFWVHLDKVVDHTDSLLPLRTNISYDTIIAFWEAFKGSPASNVKLTSSLYKEFEGRSVVSLIVELGALLKEKYHINTDPIKADEGHPTDSILNQDQSKLCSLIRKIEYAAVFIAADGIFFKSIHPGIKEIWHDFNEKIIIGRWDSVFPYTDCLFC